MNTEMHALVWPAAGAMLVAAAMIRILVTSRALVLGLVVLLFAGCGTSYPSGSRPTWAPPSIEPLDASRSAPAGFVSSLAVAYQVAESAIDLRKVVVSGDTAVAAFHYMDGTESHSAVAEFGRSVGNWRLLVDASDLWSTLPSRGSRMFPLTTVGDAGPTAVGGFVDPAVSRIDVQAPDGAVIDSDVPNDGATVVLVKGWVSVLAYEGSQLLFASPVTVGAFPRKGGISTEDRSRASQFVRLLMSSDWRQAQDLVAADVPAAYILPVLHRLLSNPGERVTGGPTDSPLGLAFEFGGSRLAARLDLALETKGGKATVWSYTYEQSQAR